MKMKKFKKKHYSKFCLLTLCHGRGCCISIACKAFDYRNYPSEHFSKPVDYNNTRVSVWEES